MIRMRRTDEHEIPAEIAGTPVVVVGDPMEVHGGKWVTLIPDVPDEDDPRIWEFDLRTGRVLRTSDGW